MTTTGEPNGPRSSSGLKLLPALIRTPRTSKKSAVTSCGADLAGQPARHGETRTALLNARDAGDAAGARPDISKVVVRHARRAEADARAALAPLPEPHHGERTSVGHAGVRPPQQPVADAEDRGDRPDRERNREQHGDGERRGAAERACRVADVLPEGAEPAAAALEHQGAEDSTAPGFDPRNRTAKRVRVVELAPRRAAASSSDAPSARRPRIPILQVLSDLLDDLHLARGPQRERRQPAPDLRVPVTLSLLGVTLSLSKGQACSPPTTWPMARTNASHPLRWAASTFRPSRVSL